MADRRAKKSDKMTGRKTGPKMGELVPQPHGGAILNGMAKNHVPGPGRPPDEIRAKMRELGATKALHESGHRGGKHDPAAYPQT